MNAGKLMAGGIVATALVAGAALYYLQVYAYYEDVSAAVGEVRLTPVAGEDAEPIAAENIRAIDSASSPIRFRACFTALDAPAMLREAYTRYEAAEPLTAPGWFECFDAEAIGVALARGEAQAFLGQRDIEYGIDRVVAIFPDGRGYVWHQINACGEVVFDGEPVPAECPPPPDSE